MAKLVVTTGYSRNNLPYFCLGNGQRKLVIFCGGPDFNHKPPSGLMLKMWITMFKSLVENFNFTVYYVSRRPNLPSGYSTRDMSEDYATMIKEEIGGPVDIMGLSSGGPIAQHFVVDHPELVHRLVLAETGYALSKEGKKLTMQLGELLRQGKWRTAAADSATIMYPKGIKKLLFKSLMWLLGKRAFGAPIDLSDGLVEIEAEVKHNFKERLAEIKVPCLVIGGTEDPFYPISETAASIPNAKSILYQGLGHDAIMKRQFGKDLLAFLTENTEQLVN